VLRKETFGDRAGEVTLRLVGLKNVFPERLLDAGVDLFAPEQDKEAAGDRVQEKVFEVDRTLLLARRG
jgi:hypothetical protein